MTRVIPGKDAVTATPEVTDFVEYTKNSDGTFRKVSVGSLRTPSAKFTTAEDVTTFAAGNLSGASTVVHHNTQGTPGSVAFRTAAQMFTDDPYATVGGSYLLRIVNAQGTGTLTVTGGATGITLTGTATIAANTWRDFVVTYTSASALVIQNVAVGTFS